MFVKGASDGVALFSGGGAGVLDFLLSVSLPASAVPCSVLCAGTRETTHKLVSLAVLAVGLEARPIDRFPRRLARLGVVQLERELCSGGDEEDAI